MNSNYGVTIERGKVIKINEQDSTARVESMTRPGIITPFLKYAQTLNVGACVFFFMFSDGSGLILGEVI